MAESEAPDQFVSESNDAATDPPAVLNVNPPSPPSSRTETTTREEMDTGRPDVSATIPGLSEMINEWQISGIPEEEQFFSTNV